MKKLVTYFVIGLIVLLVGYAAYQGLVSNKSAQENSEIAALEGREFLFRTNKGDFKVVIFAKKSPQTVINFMEYVRTGFYDETIFHRAIPGVIIQGGGYTSEMREKKTGSPVVNESSNKLLNKKGTIAMARKLNADSATSQFFVNLRDNPNLDYAEDKPGYTVFGKVVEGLPLLEMLAKNKTSVKGLHKSVPVEEIKLISVKLISESKLIEVTPGKEKIEKAAKKGEFVEGVHYSLLKEPISLLNSQKVEVVAAFSFGCGHCYGIYSSTEEWRKGKENDVEFSYFHAIWNNPMRLYARAYYTTLELGIDRQSHIPFFEAIVIAQKNLSNLEQVADFFESHGVDRKKFIDVFNSEAIANRVEQAEKLTKKFNLASVPEFVVAGKYRVDPMRAGGAEEVFKVLDYLVKKETK